VTILREVLVVTRKHSQARFPDLKGTVVLIDEFKLLASHLKKLPGNSTYSIYDFLSEVNGALDTVERITPDCGLILRVLSTLDYEGTRFHFNITRRKISWTTLPALKPDDVTQLEECKPLLERPAWKQALFDTNGHPRSVEMIVLHAKNLGDSFAQQTYHGIMNIFTGYRGTNLIDRTVLKPVALNEKKKASDDIKGTSTFSDLIEVGVYANSLDDQGQAVPTLNTIQLLKFSRNLDGDDEGSRFLVQKLLELEPNLQSRSFEMYVAVHHALVNHLLDGAKRTLFDRFPGLYNESLWDPKEISITFAKATIVPCKSKLTNNYWTHRVCFYLLFPCLDLVVVSDIYFLALVSLPGCESAL
jgi:hypothetical protein